MSEKANYFKIGSFFIVSVILFVIAVIIWGAGFFTSDKHYFETYFDTPVTGLTVGAPVESMGVKIGQVESIEFVSAVYDLSRDSTGVSEYDRYIRVVCSANSKETKERIGTLTEKQEDERLDKFIKQGLRLRLASNILTGQAYLEGTFVDPKRFPSLKINWKPHYRYLPSAPGTLETMKDSVDKILVKLEDIDIKDLAHNANMLLIEMRQLLNDPNSDTKRVNFAEVLANLNDILERVDRQTANKSADVDKFLRNIMLISDDVKELTQRLKEHPSELIFSQPPKKSEVVK